MSYKLKNAPHTDVKYAMHRIRLLKHYSITPYVVFDGGLLPSKMGTENDRERYGQQNCAKERN